MINEIKKTLKKRRMVKSVDALKNMQKIRTGRAHPGLLSGLTVEYYILFLYSVLIIALEDTYSQRCYAV